ncbi:MAG: hypothetical protein HKN87_02765 [Saprospiraceae bacterium]|nr:hypothetical protein [Saprospiraceae bacterium]
MRYKTILSTSISVLVLLYVCIGQINGQAAEKIEVHNYTELKDKFQESTPGDVFVLKDGEYMGAPLMLKGEGTATKPIIIEAEHLHQAEIAIELRLVGSFITLKGCAFTKHGKLIIEGENIRMSRCYINNSQARKWVRVLAGSMQVEIDHNHFENKTSNLGNKGCQLLQVVVRNQDERHHIHHNLFKDIPKGTENNGNGYETVQLITENNPFNPAPGDCNTIIEHNLFHRANGEAEIISIKSNSNIIRYNTFRACQGGLVLRHGHGNIASANVMFGDGEPKASGIRLQGRNQVVANNYFAGLGGYGVAMMDGTPDDLYVRVERAMIAFNSFVDCSKVLEIGLNHSKHPNGTPPKDCQIIGNVLYSGHEKRSHAWVHLVQGDQPEDFRWYGNLAFGGVPSAIKGITNRDPQLVQRPDGMIVPTANTPRIDHTMNAHEQYNTDLCGQIWEVHRSVGAIQYATIYAPMVLTEEQVGPYAE